MPNRIYQISDDGSDESKEPFVKFMETELNALGDEGWELVTAAVEELYEIASLRSQ